MLKIPAKMTMHKLADKHSTVKNFKAFMLNGFDLHERECYYIIACPPHKLELLQNADVVDLQQHAQILASGFGKAPSDVEMHILKEKYNVEF